jgi:nicotinamidase/pyrazinamidase
MAFEISARDALLIIDPQNDFCPGGSLAVAGGDEIMAPIAELAARFRDAGGLVVITQDWHPAGHSSFASQHPGASPFGTAELAYGTQVLWPDHCVQGSGGAAFHPDLEQRGGVNAAALVVRKGYHRAIDSYSAFYENDKTTPTGLGGYLKSMGIGRVFLAGLAYDFCVAWSAIDAVEREGLQAVVLKDLTRAIALPAEEGGGTTVDAAERKFRGLGVEVATSDALGCWSG